MKNKKPLVSVVIPVFNGSEYLKETVLSVMASDFRNFEVLLIDDGSRDKSKQICKDLEKKYKRVKFYSFKKNNGLGRVLNYALKKAKGKYIARINQDDLMSQTRLSKQVKFMERYPEVSLLGSWLIVEDEDGNQRINKYLETDEEIKKTWLSLSPCWDASVMYRKEIALEVGGYNQKFWPSDDLHMWYRLGKKGKIANLQKPLTTIRLHSGAASMRFHKKHMLTTFQVHRWAHEFVSSASFWTQIYWVGQLIAGYIFPAKFNWFVYRFVKRGIYLATAFI